MDDIRDFGPVIFEVLDRRGFREIGRFADREGWGTITYFNDRIGVRLVSHLGTELDIMPPRAMDQPYRLETFAEVFGPALGQGASMDQRAAYLDQQFARIERAFSESDGGGELAAIRRHLDERNRRLYGMR